MKVIVLDVDETLIHSSKTKTKNSIKLDDAELHLNPRPYLNKFLKFLFENYKVMIWSAGEKTYIEFFVKKFIHSLGYKPIAVWTRNDCDTILTDDNSVDYIKPLPIIWKKYESYGINPRNTIIIDDKKSTAVFNPTNHIFIKRFENQEDDKELYKLALFLDKYRNVSDVRRYCCKF